MKWDTGDSLRDCLPTALVSSLSPCLPLPPSPSFPPSLPPSTLASRIDDLSAALPGTTAEIFASLFAEAVALDSAVSAFIEVAEQEVWRLDQEVRRLTAAKKRLEDEGGSSASGALQSIMAALAASTSAQAAQATALADLKFRQRDIQSVTKETAIEKSANNTSAVVSLQVKE